MGLCLDVHMLLEIYFKRENILHTFKHLSLLLETSQELKPLDLMNV